MVLINERIHKIQEKFREDIRLQRQAQSELTEKMRKIEDILAKKRQELEEEFGVPTLRAVCTAPVTLSALDVNKISVNTYIKDVLAELHEITGEDFSVSFANHEKATSVPFQTFSVLGTGGVDEVFFHNIVMLSSGSHTVRLYNIFREFDHLASGKTLNDFITTNIPSRAKRGELVSSVANIPAEEISNLPLHLNAQKIVDIEELTAPEDQPIIFQALTRIYERQQESTSKRDGDGKQ